MRRRTIVFGSLAGAFAIHIAFLACSTMTAPDSGMSADSGGPDSNMHDAVADLVQMFMDSEVPDAAAQDAGTCTCTPDPGVHTFALTFDRGRGPETPRPDYSTSNAASTPTLVAGSPAYQLFGNASFYSSDASIHPNLGCFLTINSSHVIIPSVQNFCTLSWTDTGADGGLVNHTLNANPSSVTVTTLDDTHLQFTIPSMSFTTASSADSTHVTVTNATFRSSWPSARFVTPPSDYVP